MPKSLNTYMKDLLSETTRDDENLWIVLEENTAPSHHKYPQFFEDSTEKEMVKEVKKWRRGRQNRRNYKNFQQSHDTRVLQLEERKCQLMEDNEILKRTQSLLHDELESLKKRTMTTSQQQSMNNKRKPRRSAFRNSVCSEATDSP